MSNHQLRRAVVAAVTAVGLAVHRQLQQHHRRHGRRRDRFHPDQFVGNQHVDDGNNNPLPSRPTTSSATPTSSAPATVTVTARPTDTAGAPMPSATTDLQVGDCYTVGAESIVTAIDCAQLHDGQVFFIDVALTGVDPEETDAAKLFDAALPTCSPEFETFTGSALDSEASDYDLADCHHLSPGGTHGGLLCGRRQDRSAVGGDRGECQRLVPGDRRG